MRALSRMDDRITARFLLSIADIDRCAWDRLFGAASEGFDYYLACESAVPPMFSFAALGVFHGDTLITGAPPFGPISAST